MLPLALREGGKASLRGKARRVAGENPGDEGRDQPRGRLGADPAREEGEHGLLVRPAPARDQRLGEQSELSAGGEEPRRDRFSRGLRKLVEAPADRDEPRGAGVGEDHPVLETEVRREREDLRGRANGVRTELEKEAVSLDRPDDASGAVRGLEDLDVFSRRGEGAGAGEPADAGADDDGGQAQNSRLARTISSRQARNVGSSFSPGVRRKCAMPATRAASAKSWSTS